MAFEKLKNFTKGVATRLRPLPSTDGNPSKPQSRMRLLLAKMRTKQRLVVMDAETYREHWSFRLSAQNLFVGIGIVCIVLMILTFLLIAFTPLHNLIPGYTNGEVIDQTYHNVAMLDSLETKLQLQEEKMAVLSAIVSGQEIAKGDTNDSISRPKAMGENDSRCEADSLLRIDMAQKRSAKGKQLASTNEHHSGGQLFFPPIKGKILLAYNPKEGHLGTDISGNMNEIIKSAANGTVFYAGFTADDGYVIAIQHPGNIISVYKHNSALLKHDGDMVKAGEPIAYLGRSSTIATPHLHFELWINGKTVDPLSYISF